ncbi:MAG: C4-dicarboxylate ABC transporter substrate-binding protein [Spirochaetae bacterium HGW-Spirochaetae-4]|jgi:tripartite ATP-independent transporter DctP family solute receptor|nr:MAG: C4-dicarboxylate ABC transporter substrate-binding protein [Spirochaetae bacterium HGW-Spirochaetae-8]PKL19948.1 MAG: C4-dicarboxylate ABC transporter substrate-binding protein [Spirochaetae bacterium HGW-Spirochaetae-4]
MKKLVLLVLMLSLIMGGLFAQGANETGGKDKTIKLAVGDPIGSSVGVTAQDFAKRVESLTNGKVKVEVFADGILFGGDQNAAVNMVEDGGIDAVILAASVYSSFEPRFNAVCLPYLFADYDEFKAYLAGAPGQTLLSSLDTLNIKGLSLMIRTFRNVTNSRRPITKPDDLRGLKIRVPNNRLYVEFFKAMGADPTPMNFTEVYTALQLKTIDGQENPVEVPLANKFYEVQQHISLTQHMADAYVLGMNMILWNSFDAATQAQILQAANETANFKLEYDVSAENDILKQLADKGMAVNELSVEGKAEFQKKALAIYPMLSALIGEEFVKESLEFLGK